TIVSFFEKKSFVVSGVVPLSILNLIVPELSKAINLQLINKKWDLIRQYSLLYIQESKKLVSRAKRGINTRIALLISLFCFLLIILLLVLGAKFSGRI